MENKWKEVASLFGLELEERFYIGDFDEKYYFTETGIMCELNTENTIKEDDAIFDLLNDKYEVKKAPWKPKEFDDYWYFSVLDEKAIGITWVGSTIDLSYFGVGNCFKTKEEAETKGKELMEQIEKEYEEY